MRIIDKDKDLSVWFWRIEIEELVYKLLLKLSLTEASLLDLIINLVAIGTAFLASYLFFPFELLILPSIYIVMIAYISKITGLPFSKGSKSEVIIIVGSVIGFTIILKWLISLIDSAQFIYNKTTITLLIIYLFSLILGYIYILFFKDRRKQREVESDLRAGVIRWKSKVDEYKNYQVEMKSIEEEMEILEELLLEKDKQLKEVGMALEDRVSFKEVEEFLEENENYKNENIKLKENINEVYKDLEELEGKMIWYMDKRERVIRERFNRCYHRIELSNSVYDNVTKFNNKRLNAFEKELGDLEYKSPDKLNVKCKVGSAFEMRFAGDGRLYFTYRGNQILIHRVGNKNSQEQDVKWVRENVE